MTEPRPMKLTVHDHALVHALHYLVDAPWDQREADRDMVLSILRDVLPAVTRRNPAVAPLAAQADLVLSARGDIACLYPNIRHACFAWHRLRLAAAWANINEDSR